MSMLELDMDQRPPSTSPSLFIQTGLMFLIGATALLFVQVTAVMAPPRHNFVSLVLAHLMLPGFGTLVTFGALGQMIPVILGESIDAEGSSRLALGLLVPGILLQVIGFVIWLPWLIAAGGSVVVAGTLAFCLPYLGPLTRRLRHDDTARFIMASLVYIVLAEIVGLALAVQLHTIWWETLFWRGLPIHLLLGGLGWFTGIIMGVSYKLFPMFTTARSAPESNVRRIFIGFNTGLLISIGSALADSLVGLIAGLGIVAVSIAYYILDMRRIVKGRLRRSLGSGMTQSAASLVYLALSGLILVWLLVFSFGYGTAISPAIVQQLMVAAGLLFIFGWIGNMILGMLSKIVPMLVWLDMYSDQVGDVATPTLGEMIDEHALRVGNASYQAGLILLSVAVAFGETTAAMLAAAILLFGVVYLSLTLFRVWFRAL